MNRDTDDSTVVTGISDKRNSAAHPLMSYTAVTSHREMAMAFLHELLAYGNEIVRDHPLAIDDLITICHTAMDRKDQGVTMLEGRHLRGRVTEQISRADRYHEPFSLMMVKLSSSLDGATYDSVIDTLCERMRKADLMFIFKSRIALLLPHTAKTQCAQFAARVLRLLESAVAPGIIYDISSLTYPNPDITARSAVLDWAEDSLRH